MCSSVGDHPGLVILRKEVKQCLNLYFLPNLEHFLKIWPISRDFLAFALLKTGKVCQEQTIIGHHFFFSKITAVGWDLSYV